MSARSPVPVSKKDDLEDVAWALQTAEATWSRGDHADALKWIRRAAEAASEAEADDRALELAKAAADVASLLASRPAPTPPPAAPPAPVTPPITPQLAIGEARIGTVSKPPPPLSNTPRPPLAATPKPPLAAPGPTPPRFAGAAPPLPRPNQKGPIPSRIVGPAPAAKRGRRSSPSYTEEASRGNRASSTNEHKKRGRGSRVSAEEAKPAADETGQGPPTARHPSIEEIEAWPTASLVGDDFEEDDGQHTRIGTPAYRETAKKASARPPAMGAPAPLVMSQAVRVVVWREADGVHVAPAGTQITAISVEAVLVATDPGADLAAWLSSK